MHFSEQKHIIDSQVVKWLKDASLQQAPNPHSRGLFKKDTNDDPVSEIDGIVTKIFFTPLCLGKTQNLYNFN